MKVTPKKIRRLARVFSLVLRSWHTDKQFAKIIRRNSKETNSQVCHSHDFFDANQAMIDAYYDLYEKDVDIQDDDVNTLINSAWAVAKINEFFINE